MEEKIIQKSDNKEENKSLEILPSSLEGQTIVVDHSLDNKKLYNIDHHTMSDLFIYIRKEKNFNPFSPLFIDMAGITMPSAEYFVNRKYLKTYDMSFFMVAEYVVSGSGYINYDGIRRKISAGDFYLINTGFRSTYYSDPKNPWCKKWMNFSGMVPLQLLQAYQIRDQVLVLHFNAEPYIDRFLTLLSHREDYTEEELEHQLLLAVTDLFWVINRERGKLLKSTSNTLNIREVTAFVDDNILKTNLSTKVLSDMFYVSTRTMERLFVKEYGILPQKYITVKKMQVAKRFLMEGMKTEEIATRLFYSTEGYFRKVFTTFCGMTPITYRKKYRVDTEEKIQQLKRK